VRVPSGDLPLEFVLTAFPVSHKSANTPTHPPSSQSIWYCLGLVKMPQTVFYDPLTTTWAQRARQFGILPPSTRPTWIPIVSLRPLTTPIWYRTSTVTTRRALSALEAIPLLATHQWAGWGTSQPLVTLTGAKLQLDVVQSRQNESSLRSQTRIFIPTKNSSATMTQQCRSVSKQPQLRISSNSCVR
jgi:hypothetical protein